MSSVSLASVPAHPGHAHVKLFPALEGKPFGWAITLTQPVGCFTALGNDAIENLLTWGGYFCHKVREGETRLPFLQCVFIKTNHLLPRKTQFWSALPVFFSFLAPVLFPIQDSFPIVVYHSLLSSWVPLAFLSLLSQPEFLLPALPPSCQCPSHPHSAGTPRPPSSLVVIGPGHLHVCPSGGPPAKWRSLHHCVLEASGQQSS